MTTPLRLAEIISARLCHDLAGPSGTLAATLELVAEGGADAADALDIAREAALSLQSRLRFIRAAWAEEGVELDADEIRETCAGLPAARKIGFKFEGLTGYFDPPMSRGLLNLVMLAMEALPRGGTIRLIGNQEAGAIISIEGRDAAWPAGLDSLLVDDEAAWRAVRDARSLLAPLTALILRASGLELQILAGATPPSLRLTTP